MTDIAATDQAVVDQASELEQKVIAYRSQQRESWPRLAAYLHAIHEDRAWEVLGHDSFKEWCAMPEVDLQREYALLHIRAWRELVVERGLAAGSLGQVELTKLRVVLPSIESNAIDVERALGDCVALSRSDLEQKYKGDPNAGLDAEAEPEWCTCTCGHRHKSRAKDGAA